MEGSAQRVVGCKVLQEQYEVLLYIFRCAVVYRGVEGLSLVLVI